MSQAIAVLVQAGHEHPLEPGIPGEGAPGEPALNAAIRNALVARLKRDVRLRAISSPGDLPDGLTVDVALFLHCDGVENPTARGFSFGYPTGTGTHKTLADLIAD